MERCGVLSFCIGTMHLWFRLWGWIFGIWSMKRTKFMNQWVNLDFNGTTRSAKIIDIEFQTGLGPLFLLKTKLGNQFWLTKRELDYHEV